MKTISLLLARFFLLLSYIFASHAHAPESGTPEEVFDGLMRRNRRVAALRRKLIAFKIIADPLKSPRPDIAIVTCMDFRLDSRVYFGDPRLRFDIIRVPGPVMAVDAIVEAVAIAILLHHVKVVLIVGHTDCGLVRVAHTHDHPLRESLPCLVTGVDDEPEHFLEMLRDHDPAAYAEVEKGTVLIAGGIVDTSSGLLKLSPYEPLEHEHQQEKAAVAAHG